MSLSSTVKLWLIAAVFAAAGTAVADGPPAGGPVDRELTDDQLALGRASGRLITFTWAARLRDRAFSRRYGCLLVPENEQGQPLEIRLNITARRDLPLARRLVHRARAGRWTTIAVISRRYRAFTISTIFGRLLRHAAPFRSGVEVRRALTLTPDLARRRCPGVGIGLRRTDPPTVSPEAEAWAKRAQQRYGADRIGVADILPGDVTPRAAPRSRDVPHSD